MSFDLARTLRRLRPSRVQVPLKRRPDADLPFVGPNVRPGPELLLDTTAYIDDFQDRSPREVDDLMSRRICNHSAVCLVQLTHAFGRLSPAHSAPAAALQGIEKTILAIPAHRLREPSQSAWGSAGILAGMAFRLGGYQTGRERKLLNDAMVFFRHLRMGGLF